MKISMGRWLWLGLLVGGQTLGAVALAADMLETLSADQVAQMLQSLPGWETDGQRIYRTYRFETFVESISFVNQLVAPAEAAAHHPDIAIAYSQVTVSLTTHDAGGLTAQDFALAREIDRAADRMPGIPDCEPR